MSDQLETDRALRAEADELLEEKGLRALLASCGTIHVSGSYALELMVWRDLDVYLATRQWTIDRHFQLGQRIAVPRGDRDAVELYWGVVLGDVLAGAWKIDLWAVDPDTCAALLRHCDSIAARLTDRSRRAILEIKATCWRDPEYRKGFTSQHIYRAVLDAGVTSVDEFRKFLAR